MPCGCAERREQIGVAAVAVRHGNYAAAQAAAAKVMESAMNDLRALPAAGAARLQTLLRR